MISSGSVCRKIGRYRPFCFLLLFLASSSVFLIFYLNLAPGAGELETLRQQLHLRNAHLEKLQGEIIDMNTKLNSLRSSESDCQANLISVQRRFGLKEQAQPPLQVQPFPKAVFEQGQQDIQKAQYQFGNNMNSQPAGKAAKFVPSKLWIHFDLKGAPFKVPYFIDLLHFVKKLGINGILIEWEDMFPYSGKLKSAVNGNAYTMEEIERILEQAKKLGLEIVPLVQTFGHLEWVLKLKEFAHLREDAKFPQVICFGARESWQLLTDMIIQVADVHERFGMKYFHIGADEVFQVGVCNESVAEMVRQRGRERAILWHIGRVATFVKDKYPVTVLAWHDMLVTMEEKDLRDYVTDKLEPVLWSYAEDLNMFLPFMHWMALKPFRNVWGASAFKGADGPMRFYTNPLHYIRNHESWIEQMTQVHKEFDQFQGLIITGWSRYDHMAVLCELFPVAIPSLVMSVETILAGRPLEGKYNKTKHWLQCQAPMGPGYAYGCKFPGKRIYELVNEFAVQSQQIRKYLEADFDFNGWLSGVAERELFSSPFSIEKILPYLDFHLQPLERIERDLRTELNKYFFDEVADEFVLTYMGQDLGQLRARKKAAERILEANTFQKRPFIAPPNNNNEL